MTWTSRNAPRCGVCGFVDRGNHKCPPRFSDQRYVVNTVETNKAHVFCPHDGCNAINMNVTTNDCGAFVKVCQKCKQTFSGILPRIAALRMPVRGRPKTSAKDGPGNTSGT